MTRGARRALWGLVLGLGLAIGAYAVSPLVSLWRLAAAVEARDLQGIGAQVDFRALRGSLTRQILQAHLELTGKAATLGGFRSQIVVGVGASLADPLVEQMVNPEALLAVLEGRRPAGLKDARVEEAERPAGEERSPEARLTMGSLWELIGRSSFVTPWEFRVEGAGEGWRAVGLRLRLKGFAWQLVGLDLPPALRVDLARLVPRT